MKSIGWKADSMPIVFWSEPVESFTSNPHVANGMEAEVLLPNGVLVVVNEVHYQGTNNGTHRWQGRLSWNGKPRGEDDPLTARLRGQHTVFNCIPCGTDKCQLKEKLK
jgi:hypothetical protein